MKILRIIFPAIALMMVLCVSAQAQTKIGTVDLEKILKNYWKAQRALAMLQERFTKDQSDDKDMNATLKKMNDDYEQLLQQVNDPAISDDERARRKQAADDKYKEMQDEKAVIDQFERQEMATLDDQRQRMVNSSLDEIKAAIAAKARTGGYTVVLDTSSRTLNAGAGPVELPSEVAYASGEIDLTDAVLAQLNAGAPVDASTPAVANPVPSLVSTNNP